MFHYYGRLVLGKKSSYLTTIRRKWYDEDLSSLDGQIKTGTVDLYNTSRAVEPIERLISTGAPYTWPADLVPTTTNVISLSRNRQKLILDGS